MTRPSSSSSPTMTVPHAVVFAGSQELIPVSMSVTSPVDRSTSCTDACSTPSGASSLQMIACVGAVVFGHSAIMSGAYATLSDTRVAVRPDASLMASRPGAAVTPVPDSASGVPIPKSGSWASAGTAVRSATAPATTPTRMVRPSECWNMTIHPSDAAMSGSRRSVDITATARRFAASCQRAVIAPSVLWSPHPRSLIRGSPSPGPGRAR